MKNTHRSLILILALLTPALISPLCIHAEDLISISFDKDSRTRVKNQGTLPDAEIASAGRPAPILISPGVGDKGKAIEFTNEQTGRPEHFQAVEIESNGLDNLTQWTLALWFKVDATNYNKNNPVGEAGKETLFATSSSFSNKTDPGISVRLNPYEGGLQIAVQLGDGTNGKIGYFNFDIRPNVRDGEWTFLAITFDADLQVGKMRIYGGDENTPTKATYVDNRMDEITGTGEAVEGIISIGDGLSGFGPHGSINGAMDDIYFSNKVLSVEEIEELRAKPFK